MSNWGYSLPGQLVLTALLATAPASGAVPSGPGVWVQPVAGALRLNGLHVELVHLQGPGLAALIAQTRQQWTAGTSAPDIVRVGEWQVLSRQTASDSEVLQWKGEGAQQLALYSRLARQQQLGQRPQFAWELPEACRWQQTLESLQMPQRTVQGTAQCNGNAATVLRRLRISLAADGWLLSDDGAHYPLLWRKARLQLQVVLTAPSETDQNRAVGLVAVQTTDVNS